MRLSDLYQLIREGKTVPEKKVQKPQPFRTLKQIYTEDVLQVSLNSQEPEKYEVTSDVYNRRIKPFLINVSFIDMLDKVLEQKNWVPNIRRIITSSFSDILNTEEIVKVKEIIQNYSSVPGSLKKIMEAIKSQNVYNLKTFYSDIEQGLLSKIASVKTETFRTGEGAGKFEVFLTLLTSGKKRESKETNKGDIVDGDTGVEVKCVDTSALFSSIPNTPEPTIDIGIKSNIYDSGQIVKFLFESENNDFIFFGRTDLSCMVLHKTDSEETIKSKCEDFNLFFKYNKTSNRITVSTAGDEIKNLIQQHKYLCSESYINYLIKVLEYCYYLLGYDIEADKIPAGINQQTLTAKQSNKKAIKRDLRENIIIILEKISEILTSPDINSDNLQIKFNELLKLSETKDGFLKLQKFLDYNKDKILNAINSINKCRV